MCCIIILVLITIGAILIPVLITQLGWLIFIIIL